MSARWERESDDELLLAARASPAAFGAFYRRYEECRTYIDDDLVIVLLRGGFSRLENTLFEDGKFLNVRSTRHALQDTMEGRFTEAIERLTGRQVAAFMSASHQRPDLQMEVFVLDGGPDQSSGDPTA